MLLNSHGAATLGKSVRRPMTNAMNMNRNVNISALEAPSSLEPTRTPSHGRRPGTACQMARSPRTWHPSHGIMFNNAPASGRSRLISTVVTDTLEQDLAFHSNMEDQYIMANPIISARTLPLSPPEASTVQQSTPSIPVQEGERGPLDDQTDGLEVVEDQTVEEGGDEEETGRNKPHESSLAYQMVEELFQEAKEAAEDSRKAFWSYALYRGPGQDGTRAKPVVHYCRTKDQTERIMQLFLGQKIVGFDIEWDIKANLRAGPRQNVSLIQIACEERIALFHIASYPAKDDLVAPSLKKLMEDPEITKVGVAIRGDCTRLRKYLDIDSKGLFELSHLYKLVKYTKTGEFERINKALVSLATQVDEHLHLPMFKGDVRCSDWSKSLSFEQVTYAASDSYAGVQLYNTLELKRKALRPTPPRPYHVEKDEPIRLGFDLEESILSRRLEGTDDDAASDWGAAVVDLKLEISEKPARNTRRGRIVKSAEQEESQTGNLDSDEVESLEVDIDSESITAIRELNLAEKTTTPKTRRPRAPKPTEQGNDEANADMPNPSPPKTPNPPPPKDPLFLLADHFANQYSVSHPHTQARKHTLRAYSLWHANPQLTLTQLRTLLRPSKPLAESTVVTYIADALIKAEDEAELPVARARLQALLARFPRHLVWQRYRNLARFADGELPRAQVYYQRSWSAPVKGGEDMLGAEAAAEAKDGGVDGC